MYYSDVAGLYGNNVTLTYVKIDGLAGDGTARPGADLECFVRFDAAQSGCTGTYPNDYCAPGAQIKWYNANGVLVQDTVWTNYYNNLGTCIANFRVVAPTTAGSYSISAKSANTITFPFTVSAIDTGAGTVTNHSVTCAANSNPGAGEACPCEGGNLLLGYSVTVTKQGNGMAYLHVVVDGTEVAVFTTTTNDADHGGILTIPCPSTGTHTINIHGDNEPGRTVSMVVGTVTSECQQNRCAAGCPDAGLCVCDPSKCLTECSVHPCAAGCPDAAKCACDPSKCESDDDIITQIIKFINDQPVVALAGAGVLAYLILK